MAGFRKAKAEQAALKIGGYGPPGSGKTFTALLCAEGLARVSGKRVAVVDTERGTDFYAKPVEARKYHPEAFDFDCLYSRSLTEVVKECRGLSPDTYGAVVIDSITHLWEAAIAAFRGNKTSAGTIPMHAWGQIKRPYKELMQWALSCPMHVFILGRQGNEWSESDTGELVMAGYKMKAEGETAYEPHILIRMEAVKPQPAKGKRPDAHTTAIPTAFVEKDRTGVLFGQLIQWPNFDSICAPLLGLLGDKQARVQTEDEAAVQDAETLAHDERDKVQRSIRTLEQFEARLKLAKTAAEVEGIGKEITPAVKKQMGTADVELLRNAFLAAREKFSGPKYVKEPVAVGDAWEGNG